MRGFGSFHFSKETVRIAQALLGRLESDEGIYALAEDGVNQGSTAASVPTGASVAFFLAQCTATALRATFRAVLVLMVLSPGDFFTS